MTTTAFAKLHWPNPKNTGKTLQDRLEEFSPEVQKKNLLETAGEH